MEENTLKLYDKLYGSSKDGALMTKPSTIKNTETFTGRTQTFFIQTARHEEGDRIFIECVDENQLVTRLVLPFKVAAAIAAQRDSLTKRKRSILGKAQAKERMSRGELPGFMKKKGVRDGKSEAPDVRQ